MIRRLAKILWGTILIVLPVFFYSSCNTTPGSDISTSGAAKDTISNLPVTPAPPKNIMIVDTVLIKDMKFVPAVIKVHKGDMIIWFNQDMVGHCVTEEKHNAWTSSTIAAGDSWGMKAEISADYYCAIHKVMKGKIIVLE
jgi:plastocyanin